MDLSVIITAHDEGLLLHKTILSLLESIKLLPDDIQLELLVHLDNGDDTTKDYLNRCRDILDLPKNTSLHICEGSFSDLGLSRNNALKQASGKYVFFIDADDLISRNFLQKVTKAVRENPGALYHVENVLSFGEYYELTVNHSAASRDQAAYELCSRNMWPSSVFGKKDLFLKHPYHKTADGYGHEDYIFNTETVAAGVLHYVVPGTILFYRRKAHSLSLTNAQNRVIQPYSELFDFSYFKTLPLPETNSSSCHSVKESIIKNYKNLRNHKIPNLIISPAAALGKKLTGKKLVKSNTAFIDQDFIDQWIDASDIETQIFPFQHRLDSLSLVSNANLKVGRAYHQLSQKVKSLPNYVFIAPWVNIGGADKVLVAYINALLAINKATKIAVITTEPAVGEWENRIADKVSLIDFGRVAQNLNEDERDELFSRLIVQLKCRRIHNINSMYAYRWLARHLDYVRHHLYVSVSIFARTTMPNTKNRGFFDYADPFAVDVSSILGGIYTDNNSIVQRHIYHNGFKKELVKIHYQPVQIPSQNSKSHHLQPGKRRILWASRICPAKNPQLLAEIARRLDPSKYHIDAFGKPDEGMKASLFKSIPSLTYRGTYNNIEEIDPSSYDAFLYTSVSDGLPNVLLEVAAHKVPIIASHAGGIGDLITNDNTGYLIEDLHDPSVYIEAIERLFADYPHSQKLAQNAYNLVNKRHSMKHFITQVKADFVAKD